MAAVTVSLVAPDGVGDGLALSGHMEGGLGPPE